MSQDFGHVIALPAYNPKGGINYTLEQCFKRLAEVTPLLRELATARDQARNAHLDSDDHAMVDVLHITSETDGEEFKAAALRQQKTWRVYLSAAAAYDTCRRDHTALCERAFLEFDAMLAPYRVIIDPPRPGK